MSVRVRGGIGGREPARTHEWCPFISAGCINGVPVVPFKQLARRRTCCRHAQTLVRTRARAHTHKNTYTHKRTCACVRAHTMQMPTFAAQQGGQAQQVRTHLFQRGQRKGCQFLWGRLRDKQLRITWDLQRGGGRRTTTPDGRVRAGTRRAVNEGRRDGCA